MRSIGVPRVPEYVPDEMKGQNMGRSTQEGNQTQTWPKVAIIANHGLDKGT